MPNSHLNFHGCTDVGIVRDHNEDAFGFFLPGGASPSDQGKSTSGGDLIVVVSDGVGGHEAGELASNSTVAGVGAVLSQIACEIDPRDLDRLRPRLEQAMAGLNANLRAVARHLDQGKKNMAATLTAVWFGAGRLVFVHAGDSRLYRWRDGKLAQVTIDDTKAGRAIAKGRITEEAARADASWHIIERAMGLAEQKFAVTIESHEVQDGDLYMICSDGLTSGLTNQQLEKGFARYQSGELAAFNLRLIEAGNQASGRDNITTALIEIGTGWSAASRRPENRPFIKKQVMPSKHIYLIYALLTLSLIGLAALAYSFLQSNQQQLETLGSIEAQIQTQSKTTLEQLEEQLSEHKIDLQFELGQLAMQLSEDEEDLRKLGQQQSADMESGLTRILAISDRQSRQATQDLRKLEEKLELNISVTEAALNKATEVSGALGGVWASLDQLKEKQAAALVQADPIAPVVVEISDSITENETEKGVENTSSIEESEQ